jgi:hypothetical protein
MKHIKLFENFLILEHAEGDMVYVDNYGPKTLGFSDNGGTRQRDLPFRPQFYGAFDRDTKYEIVHMEGDVATLYDNNNVPTDIGIGNLYSNSDNSIMDESDLGYIKECVMSSFEDLMDVDGFEYQVYLTEILINIDLVVKGAGWIVTEFDEIYDEEFNPRLEDMGYEVNKRKYMIKRGNGWRQAGIPIVKIQISISK